MNRVESSSVSSEYEENDRYEGVDPSSLLAGHDSDIASRYGSAIKEYDVAYQGIDYENNEVNRLSLKKISKWKSSESSKAGYAAESITVAKENSENAVSGSKDRVKRSDDIKKQTDSNGNIVGGTNDTNFDVVSVTEDGVYISNTGRQLKYRGQSADECTSIVLGKEMDRYFDVGAEMEIPEDYYDEVMENIGQKIEYERKEYEECQKKGDKTGAETHKEKVERYKQREKGIRKGKLTSKEAYYAVQNPELYTIASEAILSHKA